MDLHPDCGRARFWASLALDGELSELEQAALDEHLLGCGECRGVAAALGGFTSALRSAELEQPAPLVLASRVRRRVRRPALLAAAAVVVIAVGAGSLVGRLSSGGAQASSKRVSAVEQRPFIEQQLLALANGVALPHRAGGHGRAIAS